MHKWADVLRAIADGKEVQYKAGNGLWVQMVWNDDVSPISHPELEWRIKLEPKPDVVLFVGVNNLNQSYISEAYNVISHWRYKFKVVLDGETNVPKSAELVK